MFKTVKGSSGPSQKFLEPNPEGYGISELEPNPEVYIISELSVDKILTVHLHGIEKKFYYGGFEINSERNIKSVFQIDY